MSVLALQRTEINKSSSSFSELLNTFLMTLPLLNQIRQMGKIF